jgi:hypothetical protein
MGFLRTRGGQIALAVGGVVLLALLIWLIIWISVQGDWPTVRDIALVVLALVTFVPLLALAYAALELVRTARGIIKEVLPVLDELKETTHSVRETTKLANDFTVKPAVKTAGFLVGFSQAASIMMGTGAARKRQAERRRRAAEAVQKEAEADHVAR